MQARRARHEDACARPVAWLAALPIVPDARRAKHGLFTYFVPLRLTLVLRVRAKSGRLRVPRLRRIPSAGRPLGVPNTQEKWGAAGHELSVGERGGVCGRY